MMKKRSVFLVAASLLCLLCSLAFSTGAEEVILGDANGDGQVSSRDAVRIKQHIMGTHVLSEEEAALADVNADGMIDSRDALLIEQYVVGMPVRFGKEAVFTVTFLDINGDVIKTEKVHFGEAAAAPVMQDTDNAVFIGWSTSFDNITADLTVMARYKLRAEHTVTFLDGYGRTLSAQKVKDGLSATPPAPPLWEGYTFLGWSESTDKVTKSMTVAPLYRLEEGDNILALSYLFHEDDRITMTLSVKGRVKFAGLQMEIGLPRTVEPLQFAALDTNATVNEKDGTLYAVFTSITDVTCDKDIMSFTFRVAENTESVSFAVEVSEIYDEAYIDVPYRVIGSAILP